MVNFMLYEFYHNKTICERNEKYYPPPQKKKSIPKVLAKGKVQVSMEVRGR